MTLSPVAVPCLRRPRWRPPCRRHPRHAVAPRRRSTPPPAPIAEHADRLLAERALAYLRDHLDAALSVSDLAAVVHVSPRTLQRALKHALDRRPKDVILAIKMEESRRLLASGALRVSEVAYRVGFASADHFSRRFKRYHGVSPSEVIPA